MKIKVSQTKVSQTKVSKLTKKYQATIPEPVRRALELKVGDSVAFDIEGDDIYLRKARPIDWVFSAAVESTLSEWTSEADDKAYRGL